MVSSFWVAYILGGVTFLPLVLLSLIGYIILTSEVVVPDVSEQRKEDRVMDEKEEGKMKDAIVGMDTKLSMPIVARRTFLPQKTTDGKSNSTATNYVSTFRSFLSTNSSTTSLNGRLAPKPKDTYHMALKGSTLYLYTDESCVELHDVVDLSPPLKGDDDSWDVDIYPSEGLNLLEGELFAKRNCVRLYRRRSAKPPSNDEPPIVITPTPPEAYYLWAPTLPLMETLYHSLLHTCNPSLHSSIPRIFHPSDLAAFISTLDSTSDPLPTRWLNALVARLFYSYYRTATLEKVIKGRINKKLARIKRPTWLTKLEVARVDVGTTPPMISKPMLKNLSPDGEAAVELLFSYKGNFRITLSATLSFSLTLPSLPLTSTTNAPTNYTLSPNLTLTVQQITGNVRLLVKPPPTNRVWWGFTAAPTMEMSVIPEVSERRVRWSVVLGWVEGKVKEAILESLVLPNMDDIPFFSTEEGTGADRRGGIWGDAERQSNAVPESLSLAENAAGNVMQDHIATNSSTEVTSVDELGPDQILNIPGSLVVPSLEKKEPSTPTRNETLSTAEAGINKRKSWFGTIGANREKKLSLSGIDEFGVVEGDKEKERDVSPSPPETAASTALSDATTPKAENDIMTSELPLGIGVEAIQLSSEDADKSPEKSTGISIDIKSDDDERPEAPTSRQRADSTSSSVSAVSSRSTSSRLSQRSRDTSSQPDPEVDTQTASNTRQNATSGSFLARARNINLKDLKDIKVDKEMLSAQAMGTLKKWGWKPRNVTNASSSSKSEDEEADHTGTGFLSRSNTPSQLGAQKGRESYATMWERVRERTASSPNPAVASAAAAVSSLDSTNHLAEPRTSEDVNTSQTTRGRSVSPSPAAPASSTFMFPRDSEPVVSPTPIKRLQPSVSQMPKMVIPGIHTSRKGDVMSISSDSVGRSTPMAIPSTATSVAPTSSPVSSLGSSGAASSLSGPPPLPPRRSSVGMSMGTIKSLSTNQTPQPPPEIAGSSSFDSLDSVGAHETAKMEDETSTVLAKSPAHEALTNLVARDSERRISLDNPAS